MKKTADPEMAELARKLTILKQIDEFGALVDLGNQLIEHWRKFLSKFSVREASIELIAKERIQYTSMIAGVEGLFRQMEDLVKEQKEREKNDYTDDE